MPASSTVVAALKYQGGVVIGADSQSTDLIAHVRWQVEKLGQVGTLPVVVGFSGSWGRIQQARDRVDLVRLHPNQLKNRQTVQTALEQALLPVYTHIQQHWSNPPNALWQVAVWGLAVMWAGDAPQILELEMNGETSFHDFFHAIGSGSQTAYAIYRTLGGRDLIHLTEQKAVWAMLRLLRTCIGVESFGVDGPASLWTVSQGKSRRLSEDELQTHLQSVSEWEQQETRRLLDA